MSFWKGGPHGRVVRNWCSLNEGVSVHGSASHFAMM